MAAMSKANPKAPLSSLLVLSFLASIGTAVFWNGLSFITENDFSYTPAENFLLYLVTGLIYTAGALASGPLTRLFEQRLSPRELLGRILLFNAVVCILPVVVTGSWSIWVVACVVSVAAAMQWPIVESFLSSGRHGREMRFAMGWWNIAWTGAMACTLIAMAPLMGGDDAGGGGIARWAIVGVAACNLLALLALRKFPPSPGEHDETTAATEVTAEYPHLLRSAQILLPLSYVLVGTISPLIPYVLEQLEVNDSLKTPATATWMITRVIAIAVMWRLPFWHGRWGALLLGGAGLAVGFVMIIIAPNAAVLLAGLAIFGCAQGLVYFAALYYAMTVGRAAVDAGGMHEGLIGLGYAIGPALGLASIGLVSMELIPWPMEAMLILLALLTLAGGSVAAFASYRRARRLRSSPDQLSGSR